METTIEISSEFFKKWQSTAKLLVERDRLKEIYEPGGWMKRLLKLDAPHLRDRLIDRIYRDILVRGESYAQDRKGEFQEGITLLRELMVVHDAYTKERGPFGDMFGEYLIQHGKLNARAGQVLTPINVCDLMVAMNCGLDSLEGPPKKISDPCAGCGRFMLRTAKYYADNIGKFNFLFYNVDIDKRMYTCCSMNAILNAIPSINIWGDSLSLECWEGLATIPIGRYAMWRRFDGDRAKALLVETKKKGRRKDITAK